MRDKSHGDHASLKPAALRSGPPGTLMLASCPPSARLALWPHAEGGGGTVYSPCLIKPINHPANLAEGLLFTAPPAEGPKLAAAAGREEEGGQESQAGRAQGQVSVRPRPSSQPSQPTPITAAVVLLTPRLPFPSSCPCGLKLNKAAATPAPTSLKLCVPLHLGHSQSPPGKDCGLLRPQSTGGLAGHF